MLVKSVCRLFTQGIFKDHVNNTLYFYHAVFHPLCLQVIYSISEKTAFIVIDR